jgi:hypothetical protein
MAHTAPHPDHAPRGLRKALPPTCDADHADSRAFDADPANAATTDVTGGVQRLMDVVLGPRIQNTPHHIAVVPKADQGHATRGLENATAESWICSL